MGALAWNIITWYYGIPSSSSHALVGLVGATAPSRRRARRSSGRLRQDSGVSSSSRRWVGFVIGATLMIIDGLDLPQAPAARGEQMAVPQRAVAGGGALQPRSWRQRHAEDDRHHLAAADHRRRRDHGDVPTLPMWVVFVLRRHCLGTYLGGWRIVKTMGSKIPSSIGRRLVRLDGRRDRPRSRDLRRHPGIHHSHHHRLDRRRRRRHRTSQRCAGRSPPISWWRGS